MFFLQHFPKRHCLDKKNLKIKKPQQVFEKKKQVQVKKFFFQVFQLLN